MIYYRRMNASKKWASGCLILALVALVLGLLARFVFLEGIVDVLWYRSLGYLSFFFLKVSYKYLVLIGVTLFFFLLIFLNFWVASRYLGVTLWDQDTKGKGMVRAFRSGALKVYTPLALLLAIPLALPLYNEWENALLFFYAPETGVTDSLFHLDVSFYLFALPIIRLIQGRVILALLVLLVALVVLYLAEVKVLSKEGQSLARGAKLHLAFVLLFTAGVQCAGYLVDALMLQYSTANQPQFFGPGYAEIRWDLPMLCAAGGLVLASTLCFISYLLFRRGILAGVLFAVLALVAHLLRFWQTAPGALEKYIVEPNAIPLQLPYVEQSIQSTLAAYQLDQVERRPFSQFPVKDASRDPGDSVELENIPLWDEELLGTVFQSLQTIRPYYRFSGVDAARYVLDDELHQVYLAAREMNSSRLPEKAQNWLNRRLKYTHGYGVAMVPAAQNGEQVMEWYIRNMPPESPVGFEVNQPSIYYGMIDAEYVIAPNKSGEFHYPGDQDEVLTDYEGDGGVSIGPFWRRMLFSAYFEDRNLFLSRQVGRDSRIHFRRQVEARIARLTPFLELDVNPYLVVTPDRMYWIQDAYTTSRWYPNSEPYQDKLNYIRNSVKIVTDAYTGRIRYYLADSTDPIARAYQRMYPGLIRDLAEMPEALRDQIRYPKDLFEIQMRMYAIYHQTDPETFYKGEDRMEFAEFVHNETEIRIQPYYLTVDLIDPGQREFMVVMPLLQYQSENLRALAVVGSDGENYGRKIMFTFPKGQQVLGPGQVNALIDQNSDIAEQMTLWNQQGSEVRRGKMIVLPLDGRMIYIQPLYMEAAGAVNFPQLKRVIVSEEENVVMDVSLPRAVKKLHALIEQNASYLNRELEEPPASAEEAERLPPVAGPQSSD